MHVREEEKEIVIELHAARFFFVIMVVSHRESSISSNIRAIIEQLNLNPVERRRLIDKTRQGSARCKSYPDGIVVAESPPKITIGVYGCKDRNEFAIPGPIKPVRKFDERSRSKAETRQRFPAQLKRETRAEQRANEVNRHATGDRERRIARADRAADLLTGVVASFVASVESSRMTSRVGAEGNCLNDNNPTRQLTCPKLGRL